MAIELRQQLRLAQQLVMTPQLQMAIKLLQLSRLEMLDTISQELEANPALEEAQEPSLEAKEDMAESEIGEAKTLEEVKVEDTLQSDIDWSNYMDEYNSTGQFSGEHEEKDIPKFENFIGTHESLDEHLKWQLLMTSPNEREQDIGCCIIGSIDDDGYLKASLDEIAEMSECSVEQAEQVLAMMKTFDPTGVCSQTLEECLLSQARSLNLDNTIVTTIIKNHLKLLENKNYKQIARTLKISLDSVIAAVNVIKELDPKPGSRFSDEQSSYIIPDIYVYKLEDEFVIVLNDDGMPKLQVNNYYKNAIKGSDNISDSEKSYIQDKVRGAAWLIKSIHQRQKTIYKVMESILKFQKPFFEKGIAHLKPMILKDVAQDIEMHESTISRVTTNKYAYTPQGIFELKYFFNSSINRLYGSAIASASVMEKIKQIIENENQKKPYSDSHISEMLKESNINIARRTIAKYREMMNILPSSKRKQY